MFIFVYDGSFEGLLTAIYESYSQKKRPGKILKKGNIQGSLVDTFVEVATNAKKAAKILWSAENRISKTAVQNIFHVFLSELENSGMLIYEYLDLGWKVGSSLDLHLNDDRVLNVSNTCRKVTFEMHRLLGLLRFKKLKGGIYYAPLEPDHNTVPLLVSHFMDRMPDQPFIIHDIKRNLAALYNKEECTLIPFFMDCLPLLDEEEMNFQKLWKDYFTSIAIPDRTNPTLQKRNMPVRYWKYLIEKNPLL